MRWKPPSSTTSGLSLVEVMVSCTIFLVLSGVLMALLFQNQKASEKNVSSADKTSALILMTEKIRQAVNGGRVIGNNTPETLDYWIYDTQNGNPVFGGPHGLVFLPGATVDPDVATLKLEDGRLVRDFQGEKKTLASLGQGGKILFEWQSVWNYLRVSGELGNPYGETSQDPVRKFNFVLTLNNVE